MVTIISNFLAVKFWLCLSMSSLNINFCEVYNSQFQFMAVVH